MLIHYTMSFKASEVVQVKVEPLCTDDEANMESENERRHDDHIHLEIKVEPDLNIEANLAASQFRDQAASQFRDQAAEKDQLTTSREVDHIDNGIKKETEQWSKASQDRYVYHVVKVERDIDVRDVGEVALQINEKTTLTQSMKKAVCTNHNVKKEPNSINISTSSMVTTPTSLYIDHVVKVERESDEFTNKGCISGNDQNYLSNGFERKAELTKDMHESEVQSDLHTYHVENDAAPIAKLYMNHLVKEELVVGPEVVQKPCQAVNQAQRKAVLRRCSVRLETQHVDMEYGESRIARNTSKSGLCLQSQQGTISPKDQNNQMGTKTKSLNHQISNVEDKPHKCDVCDFASAYRYRLTDHKKIHSGDKPFRCLLCSYASASKFNLQIHERSHAKIKPFKCDKCSYTCVQKCELQVHQRVHTGEKPFKCDYCAYASARKRGLLNHIRSHTGENPFNCEHCEYGCIRKPDFISHTRMHHMKDGQELNKIYKCQYCDFSTPLKRSWMVHERKMHSSEKLYQCKQCNYAVSGKTSYLNHIQKHTGGVEKRLKCSHCDYATNNKTRLSVHQRKHTGEKPYRCSHCAYASACKRALFVHETMHKGERKYKCNRCTYGCDNLGILRAHEKLHVGEEQNKLKETLKESLAP